MRFADIVGNEEAKRALVNMADTGRVAHAMLFFENEGCGALPLIVAYLQYLNCPHRSGGDSCGECPTCHRISKMIYSDIHFVFPTNTGSKSGSTASKDIVSDLYMKDFRELALRNPYFLESDLSLACGIEGKVGDINVAEAKSIIDKLSLTAVESGYKAVVLFYPEKMGAPAANKLLKIVEEPPEKTLFLFVTHNPDKVMQTIFSRCQSFRVLPLDRSEVASVLVREFEVEPEEAQVQASLSGGSVGMALHRLSDNEDRSAYMEIFSALMEAVLARRLGDALDAGDRAAGLDSREKQKAFCAFVSDCLRKVFMIQKGLSRIAYVSQEEKELVSSLAGRVPDTFPSKVMGYIDKLVPLLERNVNQKILFCDFVDRVFLSV